MASVEATSYPGGPPGFSIRLDRSDRSRIVRHMTPWTIPLGLLVAALVVVLAPLNGLLAAICVGLSGLTLLLPVMYAMNERMTAYYVDAHWMAEYRGRRRDVVALDGLESISGEALDNVCLKAGGRRLLVPAAAIRPTEVGQLLGAAVQRARLERSVHVDDSVGVLLEGALPLTPNGNGIAAVGLPSAPPRRAWDAVQSGRRRRPRVPTD